MIPRRGTDTTNDIASLLRKLNKLMLTSGVDYTVCGGHVIDLYLGYQSRPHKDLDVAVWWEELDRIIQTFFDMKWVIYEPCGEGIIYHITDLA